MTRLKELWKDKRIRYAIGIGGGAMLGVTYSLAIGCPQGGCPITSSPILMTFFGGLLGYSFISNRLPAKQEEPKD
jgi:hypothetical protein